MTYWNDRHRHTAECYVDETGPDGAPRRIHRPEPCAPVDQVVADCLHIGASGTCRACGTIPTVSAVV